MTEHKAPPEHWEQIQKWTHVGSEYSSCLLELRSRLEALESDRQAILGSGSRLRVGLDAPEPAVTRDRDETGDYLVVQNKPALTVEDCKAMPKHGENFLLETRNGEIHLDGYFTREDLIEIANTIPLAEGS